MNFDALLSRLPTRWNLPAGFGFKNNPVLQRELLVNLRTNRAFILLAVYQVLLAAVTLIAWPSDERLDLTQSPPSARRLVDLFFLGQYVIASLIAPSFAAGTISGEKERQTYEMLLASPLRPGAIVLGKLVAALTHLALLIVASLPIIVLFLPLGGVSVYEVAAAYLGLFVSVILFGAIGVFCSSYFSRTSNSLVVSYLVILPLVIGGVLLWQSLAADGLLRLKVIVFVVPAFAISAVILMAAATASRLLYPPDVGSEGKEIIDLEQEAAEAVGLVIQPDQFPDRLFAPPRRESLMEDGANPVYDKEIHGEIFSQGTLMLRLVIQISILLAIPLMGVLLFWQTPHAPWFAVYVIVFNLLVGPVFLAGTFTSERERQTLDLLLTTTLSPWKIFWGKFVVGFRVAFVLTSFLVWPMLLGLVLNPDFYTNWVLVIGLFAVPIVVSVVNAFVAITASLYQTRTSMALMTTYVVLIVLYVLPPGMSTLASTLNLSSQTQRWVDVLGVTSPFRALFALPMDQHLLRVDESSLAYAGQPMLVVGYFVCSVAFTMIAMFLISIKMKRLGGHLE
ncbi:ABC-type transport system involved in multi-copper enzyme maturation permease subunit [Rhodopirellula rubra]|uniref:ABC-type transport system involved in multi-copper enzyme maturation permease subunit n=1 Tax=Aporhodopirellula rubra TaxID=980271 RepID=A0A7W5H9W9_9BACT|nr:ABC-type transport system involved in multi-copper enzyme maturation permease subunit [Aporhodopirellula rubra]